MSGINSHFVAKRIVQRHGWRRQCEFSWFFTRFSPRAEGIKSGSCLLGCESAMPLSVGVNHFKVLFFALFMHQIIVFDNRISRCNELIVSRVHHEQRLIYDARAVVSRDSLIRRSSGYTLYFFIQFIIIRETRVECIGIIERIAACLSCQIPQYTLHKHQIERYIFCFYIKMLGINSQQIIFILNAANEHIRFSYFI